MRREQRRPWIITAEANDQELCRLCRFAEGPPDDDDMFWCIHPLGWQLPDYVTPGDDCWGFRPARRDAEVAS